MPTAHEVFNTRFVKAMNERNYDEYEALLTDDYVGEYPQSGEVIRGAKNARAIVEHYPGGLPRDTSNPRTPKFPPTAGSSWRPRRSPSGAASGRGMAGPSPEADES